MHRVRRALNDVAKELQQQRYERVEGQEMGRASHWRRPQRPHSCCLPRTRRPLRRRPRAPAPHRRRRHYRRTRPRLQVLPLQLPPEPPPTFHHQVSLTTHIITIIKFG